MNGRLNSPSDPATIIGLMARPSSLGPLLRPLMVLALLDAHCQDYRFEQKCPEGITETQVTKAASEPTPADILFVVDNSGSMADEQENLATNFNMFINQIAGADNDYRIAVVSTDQSFGEEQGGLRVDIFAPDAPFELQNANASGCSGVGISQGCFRGPNANTRVISTQDLNRQEQIDAFQANVRVGSCGTGDEEGLEAMLDALRKSAPGGCNAGFLRPEANLVIIFVSDEDDHGEVSVNDAVQQLATLKNPEQIRIAAIVGYANGNASDCRTPLGSTCGGYCTRGPEAGGSLTTCNLQGDTCGAGETCRPESPGSSQGVCDVDANFWWFSSPENCGWCSFYNAEDCCSALSGNVYVDFARAMEARIAQADPSIETNGCRAGGTGRTACLLDSICQDNFGATLEAIARDLVVTNAFSLNPPAENPSGVFVKITGGRFGAEGRTLTSGVDFVVNQTGTSLEIMGGENLPTGDEQLEIFYVSEIERPNEQIGACGPNQTVP